MQLRSAMIATISMMMDALTALLTSVEIMLLIMTVPRNVMTETISTLMNVPNA